MRMLESIAARRAELDARVEELARQLEEARAEREELAVAEKVLRRLEDPVPAQTRAGSSAGAERGQTLVVPHREAEMDGTELPDDYRRIWETVRSEEEPMMAKDVCVVLDLGVEPRVVEPARGKLRRLAERGWLRKTNDGRFASDD
ncbi:hypothetical protein [Streptomyces sp. AJS327]|uniref:hypothetical protein n=1 Tax=Streptomyces sp. AJS327 TaxID=2545265 RepID=UPI001C608784|nr:hypothetical protein [Streptomyces sp. AJS327]